MVIVSVSPGLANQMYEYASAYALAKELGQELVIDISECIDSAWDYCLDCFKIPDTRKIVYPVRNVLNVEHSNPKRIPVELRKDAKVLVKRKNDEGYFVYENLKMAESLRVEDNIYMSDYFFKKEEYFSKYWSEIREFFVQRQETVEVSYIKMLIKNKVSVGVHIRRGDMLLTDWAVMMEDDYYKAAIEYCREQYGKCIFLIFSDDIEYAKDILGQDSSLYYVHFLGYSDADLNEFICLSLCDHRIMSNSSTFSRLADELNRKRGGITLWKETASCDLPESKLKIIKRKIKRIVYKNIKLTQFEIKKYREQYVFDKEDNIPHYLQIQREILNSGVDNANYKDILEKICICSMNVYHQTPEIERQLEYKKFLCLIRDNQYSNALQSAFKLYNDYSSDKDFLSGLIEALLFFGAYEEAVVECVRMRCDSITFAINDLQTSMYCRKIFAKLKKERRRFIIIPYSGMSASAKTLALVELGLVLQHLGHNVSFVFSPIDNEEYYIRQNEYLVNRHGVCLGCRQYLLEEVQKTGIADFLNISFSGDIVLVSRIADFFIDKQEYQNGNMQYVFPDFSDSRDAEVIDSNKMKPDELNYLYNKADLILTKRKIRGNGQQKIVNWEDNDSQDVYYIFAERWELGKEHRLCKWAIGMAADLLDNL